MPYVDLGNEVPGTFFLFEYRPEMANPLRELAEALQRNPEHLQARRGRLLQLLDGLTRGIRGHVAARR